MQEFKGKTVLITGAGRGIGKEAALSFAAAGANVCINYAHSKAEADEVAKQIQQSGGKAIAIKANIASASEVNVMVDATMETFGAIDILVNNAGLSRDGPFIDMSEDDWDRVYEVNLKGPFLVSQAVAKCMLEQDDGGVIVNISATTTVDGRPNAANYCASKAGLNMLTKCMAIELGPAIRVNAIGLGYVESPLVHALYSDEQLQQVMQTTPLKRMTSNDETVAFIKLLASQSTAFVTGQTIMFDGGFSVV